MPGPRRRRANATLSLDAALEQVERWKQEIEHPRGETAEGGLVEPVIDYQIVITYIAPGGTRRQEVTEKEAKEGRDGSGPLPGEYEIDAVDSNGESILAEPWKATVYDPDSVKELAKGGGSEQHPALALFTAAGEEARITIRDQRYEIEAARKREQKARDELNLKIDEIGRLMREKSNESLRADRAIAEMELAKGREKEALEAFEGLKAETESWRPHIAMAIDHGIERLGPMLMGESVPMASNDPPIESAQPQQQQQAQSDGPTFEGNDPPPPGAEDPRARASEFLETTVRNIDVLWMLVHEGAIPWELARAIYWNVTHVDLGPDEPNWDEVMGDNGEPDPQEGAA